MWPAARYWLSRGAARDDDVAVPGHRPRLRQRRLDAVGHEVERRPALHHQGLARVVRQDEDGRVVGRVVAPPTPSSRPTRRARGRTCCAP